MWASLHDLPEHLIEVLLGKLQEDGGMKAAAVIRLVCKAWLTAFGYFPKSAHLCIKQAADKPLERLCKIMPCLFELTIQSFTQELDLSPLNTCFQLTKLQYNGRYGATPSQNSALLQHDLRSPPKSLRELTLEGIELDQGSVSSVKFTGLTKLICLGVNYTEDLALWDLL